MTMEIDLDQRFTGGLMIVFVRPFTTEDALEEIKEDFDNQPASHVALEDQPLSFFVKTVLNERGLCGRDFILRAGDLAKGVLFVEVDLTPKARG